jgi:adenylate kinase
VVYVVNLVCPNGHAVCGRPQAYASEDPPKEWLETISCDLIRLIQNAPANMNRCRDCGAQYSRAKNHEWSVSIHKMRAKTLNEAAQALATCSETTWDPTKRT